eukprot:2512941-Rhodomonas_salina.1
MFLLGKKRGSAEHEARPAAVRWRNPLRCQTPSHHHRTEGQQSLQRTFTAARSHTSGKRTSIPRRQIRSLVLRRWSDPCDGSFPTCSCGSRGERSQHLGQQGSTAETFPFHINTFPSRLCTAFLHSTQPRRQPLGWHRLRNAAGAMVSSAGAACGMRQETLGAAYATHRLYLH